MKRIAILSFILWAVCFGLYAQDGDAGPDNTGAAGVESGEQMNLDTMGDSYSFVRSLMALSFVLGLIFLATYFFKKITGMKRVGWYRARGGNRVPIRQVGALPLGEKKFLSIVEIQGKHYFIGITPNTINMLSEIELDMEDIAEAAEKEDREAGSAGSFASVLSRAKELLNKGKK